MESWDGHRVPRGDRHFLRFHHVAAASLSMEPQSEILERCRVQPTCRKKPVHFVVSHWICPVDGLTARRDPSNFPAKFRWPFFRA
jgi:hypothetical protein